MSDLETRLDRALRADAPQARDPMFRIQVMERRERTALRRRILVGFGLALGAAVLAALGLTLAQTLFDGAERLAAITAIAAVLMALLAAPHMGGRAALRGLAQQASSAIRTLPRVRLWF
jgi:uncharacterized membrane protein YqjE